MKSRNVEAYEYKTDFRNVEKSKSRDEFWRFPTETKIWERISLPPSRKINLELCIYFSSFIL